VLTFCWSLRQTIHELRVEVSELKYLLQNTQKKAASDAADAEKKLETTAAKAHQVCLCLSIGCCEVSMHCKC
jgi:hypothetical protein